MPLPALTATLSGFVNGDTGSAVSGSAALTTIAKPRSGVGQSRITVSPGSLAAVNYDFPNLVDETLTVGKCEPGQR